jgi:hypothetical protein
MARRPTPRQSKVLEAMRRLDRPVRPREVVATAEDKQRDLFDSLPHTESSARGVLKRMLAHGWIVQTQGTPARFALPGAPSKDN